MVLEIGTKALEFSLEDQDGKEVTLASLAGKWTVLYFYPKDDTPGCTLEAVEFTKLLPAFAKVGAQVLGVSGDTPESHCDFQTKHKLKVRLLSDPGKKMMTEYGAFKKKLLYGKSFLGIVRSTVLIDPKGVVRHYWPAVKAQGHAQEVLERIGELRS